MTFEYPLRYVPAVFISLKWKDVVLIKILDQWSDKTRWYNRRYDIPHSAPHRARLVHHVIRGKCPSSFPSHLSTHTCTINTDLFSLLQEGDVILTGTPSGVGPVVPGDKVECALTEADGKALLSLDFDAILREGGYRFQE